MVSTPGNERNYYSNLMKKRKADGTPVFNSVLATHLCDNCRNLPIDQAVHCNHWRFLLPMRKMGDNEKDSLGLNDGRLENVMRERFAIVCGDSASLFPETIVNRCFGLKAKRYPVTRPPQVIYVGCDPGMHKSDTAYVAMGIFPEGPRIIALGLFRNEDGPLEQKQQIHSFFRALWSHVYYRDAPIVFIPEGAPAQEAYHLANHLQEFIDAGKKLLVMRELAGNRPGVPINHDKKRSLVFAARGLLSFDTLLCTRDLIAITNKPLSTDSNRFDNPADFLVQTIADQLVSMHVRVKPLHEGVDERTYITGKGYNQNDDMAMAFMTLVFWSTHFMISERPDYKHFMHRFIGVLVSIYRNNPDQTDADEPATPAPKRRATSFAVTA